MNVKDLGLALPSIVIIALITSVIPEYCPSNIPSTSRTSINTNKNNDNLFCYVKSFSPEPPELQHPTGPINTTVSTIANGTAASGVSLSMQKSLTYEIKA